MADASEIIADFFEVRRTLVCRVWPSASLKNPRAKSPTHDKLKFVGRLKQIGNDLAPPKPFPVPRAPRYSSHVISAFFPETCLIVFEKADAFDPLSGFPSVELWND